ncbi:TPA: histidine kinase [Candidatus Marinimicrobia bacterium]|nr:histidine kinase [Candidatus Neomarinimicrobiota bacterium]
MHKKRLAVMKKNSVNIHYPYRERSSANELKFQISLFEQNNAFTELINHILEFVAILNQKRQIIYANNEFKALMNSMGDSCDVLGMRPGEYLKCTHAMHSEFGCGTTDYCKYCGANQAICNSLDGKHDLETCRILREDGSAWELRIRTHPFIFHEESFVFLAAMDISHESRRRALERVFFHDIKNTAGSIRGFTKMLSNDRFKPEQKNEFREILHRLSYQLIDEIESQQQILAAEENILEREIQEIHIPDLLMMLRENFIHLPLAENKEIKIAITPDSLTMRTDKTLLQRVLGNCIKNALEAVPKGAGITLIATRKNDQITFSIHNPGAMPEAVKRQIFQRSFSTKGPGRGLGTYSIRLFTEKYLNGSVRFTSREETGTTFYIILPLSLAEAREKNRL